MTKQMSTEIDKLKSYIEMVEELKLIIDLAFDQITIADKNGVIQKVYKSCEEIFGVGEKEFIGKSGKDLEKMGVLSRSVTSMVAETKKKETIVQDTGSKRRLMVTGVPVFDEKGELVKIINFSRDITNWDDLEKRLHEAEEMIAWYEQEIRRIRSVSSSNVIWRSESMRKVLEIVNQVAGVDATVIFYGESGVGKSLLAKMIHQISSRNKGNFVTVNCGAIPANLIESELFGYEKGAFTGAKKEGKKGFFEIADHGTIFLDEIGEMPLPSQVKLLNVLQDKEIYRLGSSKAIKIDVRVIAATNKDLKELVKKGLFREDLFYRLNVIPITIPPLRERKEDIPILVNHFLENFCKRYRTKKTLSPEVLDMILNYDWPGNVRELENYIERLVVTSNTDIITNLDLPEGIKSEINQLPNGSKKIVPLKKMKEEIERQLIYEAWQKFKTTREIAKALGVNQATIVRKMKKYGFSNAND